MTYPIAAPIAARLANRFGARRTVSLGMALEAVGILAVTALLGTSVTGLQLALPLFVYGIGVGLATAQLTSITLSDIPMERSGLASGANSTMRQVGSALGIAILGTILFVSLGNNVRTKLTDAPGLPPAAAEGIAMAMETSGGQALPGLRARADTAAVVPLLDDAFVDAARLTGSAASSSCSSASASACSSRTLARLLPVRVTLPMPVQRLPCEVNQGSSLWSALPSGDAGGVDDRRGSDHRRVRWGGGRGIAGDGAGVGAHAA